MRMDGIAKKKKKNRNKSRKECSGNKKEEMDEKKEKRIGWILTKQRIEKLLKPMDLIES